MASFNRKARLRDNIEAIRIAFDLDREHRQPTDSERESLEAYAGFGGIKAVLSPADKPEDIQQWTKSDAELFPLVAELHGVLKSGSENISEYRSYVSSIKNSVLSAFYTPPPIIEALNGAIRESGIRPIRILDPSAGTGAFARAMNTYSRQEVVNFEKDLLTGKILRHLRPDDTVRIEGFENIGRRRNGYFDIAASNIPFGDINVFDLEYRGTFDPAHRQASKSIHNYFFMKGVDCIREGGLVAFITSQGVLNSESNRPVREWLMERCEPVSVVRFPNNLFSEHAGTDVGSDLIVLQKGELITPIGELSPRQRDFIETRRLSNGISINNLFQDFDRVIHTDVKVGTDPYGKPTMEFTHSGGVDAIAASLGGILQEDFSQRLDTALYFRHTDEPPLQSIPQAQAVEAQAQVVTTEAKIGFEYDERNRTRVTVSDIRQIPAEDVEPVQRRQVDIIEGRDGVEIEVASYTPQSPRENVAQEVDVPKPSLFDEPPYAPDLDPFWQAIEDDWFPDEAQARQQAERQSVERVPSDEPQSQTQEREIINVDVNEEPEQADQRKRELSGTAAPDDYGPQAQTPLSGTQASLDFDFSAPVPPSVQPTEPTSEAMVAVKPEYNVQNQPLLTLYDLFGFSDEERTQVNAPRRSNRSRRRAEIPPSKPLERRNGSTTMPRKGARDEAPLDWREELAMNRAKEREAATAAPTATSTEGDPQEQTSAAYRELKAKHADALVLLREGGHYRAMGNDAVLAARILGLTLSGENGAEQTTFPSGDLDTHLPVLVRAGQRVAIADAVETPKVERKQSAGISRPSSAYPVADARRDEQQESLRREQQEQERAERMKPVPFPAPEDGLPKHYKEGSLVTDADNRIGYLRGLDAMHPMFHPLDLPSGQARRASLYIEVRDTYHHLYLNEADTRRENPALRGMLNRLYDDFTGRFGNLNDPKNLDLIKMDAGGREILSLERYREGKAHKADIFEHPTAFNANEIVHADNARDALAASLNKHGVVDLAYMATLTGGSEETMLTELKGKVFFNPLVGNYEIADKFIAGNVISKADEVQKFIDTHPDHTAAQESLAALRDAAPRPIPFDDLDFNFGERWIPIGIYAAYASWLFETEVKVTYAASRDEFSLIAHGKNAKIWDQYAVRSESRIFDGIALMRHAMHDTTPEITKKINKLVGGELKEVKIPDGEKIQLANSKIDEIRNGFSDWLREQSPEFKERLAGIYNRTFNCFVRPEFDGGHQTFPGLDRRALGIDDLYKSQKDAVWMQVVNGGGIADHEVGTGKTLIMCCAAMEMKRLGIANKPMITGLKANIHEIAQTFCTAYPNAKVLYPGKEDFTPKSRERIFNEMKNNDWDAVILTHEQFGKIPQSPEIQRDILQKELDSVEENLEVLHRNGGDVSNFMRRGVEKRKANLEAKLKDIIHHIDTRKDDAVDFRRMGIDHLFVDESHYQNFFESPLLCLILLEINALILQ
jgi:hypothetical protein